MPLPPFAAGRRWHKRSSKAQKKNGQRLYHDQDDDFEYERDDDPLKGTWHRIRYRTSEYQEIDATTGEPVSGGEGDWHLLS